MWKRCDRIITVIADVAATISMVLIVGIMFFTTVDVVGRFFDHPILGSYQISELILVWIICLAWPFTTGVNGHVRMEILISHLPQTAQNVIGLITQLLGLGIFILLVWQGIELVKFTIEMRELVSIIDIPLYPFQFAIPIGALLTCPIVIVQIVKLLRKMKKGGELHG